MPTLRVPTTRHACAQTALAFDASVVVDDCIVANIARSVQCEADRRSIDVDMDARAAAKSMGHSIQVHYATYNSTYEKKDAIKASKKLNK